MSDSPTNDLLKRAYEVHTVTDELGRVLTYRNLNGLERMRLYKAGGPDASAGSMWMQYAVYAAMVRSIDGVPQPAPRSYADIEAAVAKLDEFGVNAIFRDQNARAVAEAEAATNSPE